MTSFKGMIHHKKEVQLTPGIAELLPGLGLYPGVKVSLQADPAPPIPYVLTLGASVPPRPTGLKPLKT